MLHFDNLKHSYQLADAVAPYGMDRVWFRSITRAGQDGTLFGGVLYTDVTKHSCQVHIAGFRPNWINRDLLWVAFHLPFVQLNLKRIFAYICEDNKRSLAFTRHIGFSTLCIIPEVHADRGLVVLAMDRPSCRWLTPVPRAFRTITDRGANQ